jgi:hypothetical protein
VDNFVARANIDHFLDLLQHDVLAERMSAINKLLMENSTGSVETTSNLSLRKAGLPDIAFTLTACAIGGKGSPTARPIIFALKWYSKPLRSRYSRWKACASRCASRSTGTRHKKEAARWRAFHPRIVRGSLGRVQVFLDILDRVPGQILVDLDDHA